MNEYDEYAVEQAVQVKEQLGGEPEITVICVGPERVKEAIKKALAMGCDKGVHILDEASHEKDVITSYSIHYTKLYDTFYKHISFKCIIIF